MNWHWNFFEILIFVTNPFGVRLVGNCFIYLVFAHLQLLLNEVSIKQIRVVLLMIKIVSSIQLLKLILRLLTLRI